MAIYSNDYANQYDILMGKDKTIGNTTKKLLTSSVSKKKDIRLLELGCGTGTILKQLPSHYKLFGLDIAESMLEIAKKKVPHAIFFHGDMSHFNLDMKFDVILCIFDAINHLTTFSQWKSMFKHVYRHLNPEGVFIFDMNTMRRMALLASFKPYVGKIGKNSLTFVKIKKKNNNVYEAQFLIFQNITKKQPLVIEQIIEETVFPITVVEKELKKYFHIEEIFDPYRENVTADSGRIFFVCRKK